jgi:hypothetical protein
MFKSLPSKGACSLLQATAPPAELNQPYPERMDLQPVINFEH